MAISSSEVRKGKVIMHNNAPNLVLSHAFHKMGRGGSVNKTKIRNLKTGNTLQVTFSGNEKVEEVEVINQNIQFLYHDGDQAYFMNPDSYEQLNVDLENIDDGTDFLKEGILYQGVFFEEELLSLVLPKKITFEVTQAAAAVKGDSTGNPQKEVELETGARINVPLFIKKGDKIQVNTETKSYVGKDN